MKQRQRIVVIGAGAFGGWTALELVRRGADVTIIDAWGPGNLRASSGGETRVLRAAYGTRAHYTGLTVRALPRWRQFETEIGRRIFHRSGVLWLFDASADAQAFASASARALRAHDVVMHELTRSEASRRWPHVDLAELATIMFEPEAGYLMSRRACEDIIDRVQLEGGTYRHAAVPPPVDVGSLKSNRLTLADGTAIEGDAFIFACGPWLGSLFPEIIGRRVIATRQEVFYFGTPAGDPHFTDTGLPAWIELSARQIYGIPGNAHRGFKVADDAPGPEMDPTTSSRGITASAAETARAFLARRFPALASAPLVGAEVCQYEASPDSELIIDRHPEADNVWITGGGSGHGFKMGPAIGEVVASIVLDHAPSDPRFALARFSAGPAEGWQRKWT